MEYSSKFDKRFFYHFMMTHGHRRLPDIIYFWQCFISDEDYHNLYEYDSNYFRALDVFNNLYGRFYKKNIKGV